MATFLSLKIHIYHFLSGISTLLAVSSIGHAFVYSPSKTVLYAFLVFPTLALLHHIFVWLAVSSSIGVASSHRASDEEARRRYCAARAGRPLGEVERSTLNLLSLALLVAFALGSGFAAWVFAATNLGHETTPAPTHSTYPASWGYFNTSLASTPPSVVPERRGYALPAMWILNGAIILAQAVVLAFMFAIAASEARSATMASRGCRACVEARHNLDSDIQRLMSEVEGGLEVDLTTVSDDDGGEK